MGAPGHCLRAPDRHARIYALSHAATAPRVVRYGNRHIHALSAASAPCEGRDHRGSRAGENAAHAAAQTHRAAESNIHALSLAGCVFTAAHRTGLSAQTA